MKVTISLSEAMLGFPANSTDSCNGEPEDELLSPLEILSPVVLNEWAIMNAELSKRGTKAASSNVPMKGVSLTSNVCKAVSRARVLSLSRSTGALG